MNLWSSLRPSSSRGKFVLAGLALALVLCLFLYRPAAGRLQSRIVRSISAAVGRPVKVSSVSLRFFPRPGFDLENFVVYDDPAFSAEPLLRASEVTASLRVRSLLHGRVGIARLDLTEPSLNLVERDGRWNLESLLQRGTSGGSPLLRSSSRGAESEFPYIEASQGRINFKRGLEKTPYALTDTDFSFWADSDRSWGVRVKAQPWRSDYNLSDMGTLRIEGRLERGTPLAEAAVRFDAEWHGAQLGQISKYAGGNDAGWRGAVTVTASITGTVEQLKLQSDLTVRDFRRFDAPGNAAIRLQTKCTAQYGQTELSEIACSAPVGDGVAILQGDVFPKTGAASLTFIAQEIPVTSLAGLARSAAKGFINVNGTQSGRVDGMLRLHRGVDSNWQWQGSGDVRDLRLNASSASEELTIGAIPFTIGGVSGGKRHDSGVSEPLRLEAGPLVFSTEAVELPTKAHGAVVHPAAMMLQAEVGRQQYSATLQGTVQANPLLLALEFTGLWTSPLKAEGAVKIDLHASGDWKTRPTILGSVQTHDLTVHVAGASEPIKIESATADFQPALLQMQNAKFEAAGTHWSGSIKWPRPCVAETCVPQFELHGDEISTDALNQFFNPEAKTRSWYQFLAATPGREQSPLPFLLKWRAKGTLKADQVSIRWLQGSGFSADVDLKQGMLTLTNLRASVLGGRHSGQWIANFAANPPSYSGSGTLENVVAEKVGALMNSGWISGLAHGTYELKMTGRSAAELLASSEAKAQITLHNGALSSWTPDHPGLPIQRFAGSLSLQNGDFQLTDAEMETPDATYAVAGKASRGQGLHLQFMRDGVPAVNVTGTMASPKISAASPAEARADLKP